MSNLTPGAPINPTPLRPRHVLYLILGVVGFAIIAAPQFLTPWFHFTGGSFHLRPWWAGAGTFTAPDGTYQLYFSLSPTDSGSHPTLRTSLDGDGHLCTPSGKQWILHVEADMDKHLPLNTLGKSLDISSFAKGITQMTVAGSPYVRLTGVWAPGAIEAKGTLEHQAADPGHPPPPRPAPISVTLKEAGEWWPPACKAH